MFEPREKIARLGLEKARRYRQEANLDPQDIRAA